MTNARMTPLGALARGLAVGVLGTAAMTAWQELSAKLQGSGESAGGGEQQQPADPWEQASVPAQVAHRVAKGVFGVELSPERIPLATNAMHWAYGTGWGAVYGLLAGSAPPRGGVLRRGALLGAAVWASSYAQLVPMGLYEPPWRYSPSMLALDASYHLVYGAGTAAGWALLDRR